MTEYKNSPVEEENGINDLFDFWYSYFFDVSGPIKDKFMKWDFRWTINGIKTLGYSPDGYIAKNWLHQEREIWEYESFITKRDQLLVILNDMAMTQNEELFRDTRLNLITALEAIFGRDISFFKDYTDIKLIDFTRNAVLWKKIASFEAEKVISDLVKILDLSDQF